MHFKSLIIIALLSGCAEFPALDGTVNAAARNTPFPTLINLDTLRSQIDDSFAGTSAVTDGMAARVARLNARADELRRR